MATIKEIYDFLDSFAPFCNQDSFDNSGLCVGEMSDPREINSVLLCLDITNPVVEEAKSGGFGAIISHHPVIFHATKHIDLSQPYSRALAYGLPCIGTHTCLDSAPYSLSDMMVDRLGFKNLGAIPYINRQDPKTGAPVGYGATAECPEMSAEELAKLCKTAFDSAALRYCDGKKPITRVVCASGACSETLEYAYSQGAQAVVTADVKLDRFLEADRLGMTLIDAGHYETEAIALPYLAKKLTERFGIKCGITAADRVVKGLYTD